MYSKYFVFGTCVILLLVSGIIQRCETQLNASKRSKRWDDYIQSLKDTHEERRVRRQAGAHEWESDMVNCNSSEYTAYDALGRRDSGLLAEVQNQRACGSCWAFASTHAVSDQLSLLQGSRQPLLSANHLTLCNKDKDLIGDGNGCCGGRLDAGPAFFKSDGAVTNECSPYSTIFNSYDKDNEPLPSCPTTCSDGTPLTLSLVNRINVQKLNNDQEIIDALDTGNVVIAGMFFANSHFSQIYTCGIYQEPSDIDYESKPSGHAVLIVDYGTSPSGTNFWVVKNSWGIFDDDGEIIHENGYFRIARGHLRIAFEGIAYKILISSTGGEFPTDLPDFQTCAAVTVSNPTNNEMVMSAEEFVRQELITMNQVLCRGNDGGQPTELILDSITSAEVQNVAGTNIDVQFSANVTGCEQMTVVDITADVFVDLGGGFTLDSHSITIRSNNSAKTPATSVSWLLLLFAAVVAILEAASHV